MDLGRRHFVIIDEAHLVPHSGDGMYRSFINDLSELNPKLKIAGLTATPFRMGDGPLFGKDLLFTKICYEAKIQPLIAEGFLCPITSTPPDTDFRCEQTSHQKRRVHRAGNVGSV